VSVIFGKWMNTLPTLAAAGALGGFISVVGGFWYWATPKFWEVGYMPTQPGGGFNHQLHAGQLGMDCRYCHTNVERAAEANIPPVSVCYGCHAENHVAHTAAQTEKTEFICAAYTADESIPWRRVHKLPDYVRNFPHDVHVNAGVSCFSCHGQMDALPVVSQRESLSMGWCLDCHRATANRPEAVLVPRERVTDLVWVAEHMQNVQRGGDASVPGFSARAVFDQLRMTPPENCGACHY
jgi:hypothetical protein